MSVIRVEMETLYFSCVLYIVIERMNDWDEWMTDWKRWMNRTETENEDKK